jgi:hypothetical protein
MAQSLGNPGSEIKVMKELFDYVFFRVYMAYRKRDSNPEIYAANTLSLMQFLVVIDLMFLLQLFLDFDVPSKFFFIPVLLVIIGINWYVYEHNVDVKKFEVQWGAEDIGQRKRRGWLIMISLILLVVFPILVGVLKHNLGII